MAVAVASQPDAKLARGVLDRQRRRHFRQERAGELGNAEQMNPPI
jgi:hypothetical protein